MDLFGFEDDLDLHNSEITPRDNAPKPINKIAQSEDAPKLTISQIQELLVRDVTNDTVSDQDTLHNEETSIFEETGESLEVRKTRPRRAVKKVLQSIENTDSASENVDDTAQSEYVMPVVRAYTKPNRRKKVLQPIENTHTDNTSNSSAIKSRRNNRKKAKMKNDENEKVDSIAEEINNKFKEVEQYKLMVE